MNNGVYPDQQPSAVQVMAWYAIAAAVIGLISVGARAVTDVIETVGTAKRVKEEHKYKEQHYSEEYP